MSKALTAKEIASAAAEGVAIALNARKLHTEVAKEEAFRRPILICGIPPELFRVVYQPDESGALTPGGFEAHPSGLQE